MGSTIKNIIFDFGGVLMDWNPRYLYRSLFDDPEKMEFFLENICTSEWNEQQDAGRSLGEATRSLQSEFPEYADLIQKFYGEWSVMLKDQIHANTALLPLLRERGYRLFGLTNWSHETLPTAKNRYNFFENFEGIVVSGEEKMIKPDEGIYRVLLERYKLRAEESLFIDDNSKNIATAHRLGFRTIHYAEQSLTEDLQNLRVL